MDPDALQVTTGADFGDDLDTGNGAPDLQGWPAARPKREAIEFLGQALAAGVPKPSYDGPIQGRILPHGRAFVDQTSTLPLDTPLVAQPTLQIGLVGDSTSSIPEPHLETLSPSDLQLPEDDFEVTANGDQNQEDPNPLAKTANEMSPPRGIVSRPKLRGILRKEGSSHASASSSTTGEDAASIPRQYNTSGARRNVKFQLPQGEEESVPPEVVEARPRRIIKIKSRAAVQYLRELEKKK